MGGFNQLPNAIDPGLALAPILEKDVRAAEDLWTDEVALGIVLSDTQEALSYLNEKGLSPIGIETADDLVRGYVRPRQWADGKPRANLSMHVTLQAIEKIMPALYMSLFGNGKKRPFLVDPIGKTSPAAARANASLLAWAIKKAKLPEEMRLNLKNCLTYGFTVGTWGWESKTLRKKSYERDSKDESGKMVGKWKTFDIELPTYECLDLKQVLVDPGLKRQDVQAGARYVIKQVMTNGYGLADFRENESYKNIPTDSELAFFLANRMEPTEDSMAAAKRMVWREFQAKLESETVSKDPMMQPLEILEYTTEDRVVTVLQRKLVIRNEENEFAKLNFQSCAFIDVLNSAWGFGIAKLLSGEQRLQQGVVNNWIDSLALILNPVFQLLKGIGPGTQSIPLSPGKVINESGELKPLVVPDVTKPAMEAISASDMRAGEKVGSNGGSDMSTGIARTAQGVQAFAGDVIQRLQYFLEIFINLIYVPTLEAFLQLLHDHLTVEQVNAILTEQEGKAYESDISEVYNAEVNLSPIAGANMMARFAAAQLVPQLFTLVSSGPVADQFETQGVYFNYLELISETVDMFGLDVVELIIPMTPEMKQAVKDKNAAMNKVQGDMQLEALKHKNNLEDIDAKGSTQADVAVVRGMIKDHQTEAEGQITGQPSGQ